MRDIGRRGRVLFVYKYPRLPKSQVAIGPGFSRVVWNERELRGMATWTRPGEDGTMPTDEVAGDIYEYKGT